MRIADALSQANFGFLSLDHKKTKDDAGEFGNALAQAGIDEGPALSEHRHPVEVSDWEPYRVSSGEASVGLYTPAMARAALDQMHSIKALHADGLQKLIEGHEAIIAANPAMKAESERFIESYKADMATAARSWDDQIAQFEQQMASFLSRTR